MDAPRQQRSADCLRARLAIQQPTLSEDWEMRILWTLPYLPWPTTSGSKTRQYHLLRQLAEHGHRITLLVQSKVPWAMPPAPPWSRCSSA